MAIPFLKMQGLGNDFVVIDDLGKPSEHCRRITPELARRICDRRFGVGADQLLWLKEPQGVAMGSGADAPSDARMEIFNADGSVAEMCGNGIRAAALYLHRHGPRPKRASYRIETLAGVKEVVLGFGDGSESVDWVAVDMGMPVLGAGFTANASGERIEIEGRAFRFFEVDLGNPHAVVFVGDDVEIDVGRWGKQIEVLPRFPRRTNVEFVEILSESVIRVRVWERGSGLTLACGTGACASAVAALATGRVRGEVEVRLPGGALWVSWRPGQGVIMRGPAEEVFRGEFLE